MAIEFGSVGMLLGLQIGSVAPEFRDRHGVFAVELDKDFLDYQALLTWLRRFDSAQLQLRQVFVHRRREALDRKLGLFTGGWERLGILPLLVGLYFQLRGYSWPPNISLFEAVIATVLVLAYSMSWWAVGKKLRLELYDALLTDALSERGVHSEST